MDTKQKKRRTAPAGQSRRTKAQAAARSSKPQAQTRQRRTQPERRPTPDVVYTPAKPFNRNRLLLRLATVAAVVLALVFGISIFFKVENITVSGAEKYSAWTVKEASGIEIGDNLLTFGKAKAYGRIMAKLPYVKKVHIGIKLPDTVNIEITEQDVVYAIKDSTDAWWLMTSGGKLVEQADSAKAGEHTQILGVALDSPVAGQQAVAWEWQPDPTGETGQAQPAAVRGSDRLSAALSILQYLEDCGIIGQAASVDVSELGDLELWYGQQYQVKLGDTSQLNYKIRCMNEAINGENGLKDYDSGVLDISFTIKKDQIVYEPLGEE